MASATASLSAARRAKLEPEEIRILLDIVSRHPFGDEYKISSSLENVARSNVSLCRRVHLNNELSQSSTEREKDMLQTIVQLYLKRNDPEMTTINCQIASLESLIAMHHYILEQLEVDMANIEQVATKRPFCTCTVRPCCWSE
jgi:hypothetical protein